MTRGNAINVAADRLVRYAQARFEDSYAYHAIANYILDIAAVPRWAWSRLPWSDQWARGWQTSFEHRATDARTIRDQMGTTGGKLVQVAADYTGTDVQVAVDIELKNQDLGPYLAFYTRGVPQVTAAAGGYEPYPDFPQRPPPPAGGYDAGSLLPGGQRPDLPVPYPPGNDRLQQLRQETRPRGAQPWLGPGQRPDTVVSGYTFGGAENDELERFVQRYGGHLMGIEATVRGLDPGVVGPWSELVEPAWLTCPSIIDNRAELLCSVASTYDDLATDFHDETRSLRDYWDSPGAALAYRRHAEVIDRYLQDIKARTDALADEATKAAELVMQLRTIYAGIGFQHIRQMIDRHEEYLAVTTSALGRVAECTSPVGAAKAFVATVQDYNAALTNEQRRSVEAAEALLMVESIVVAGRPDFGRIHDPVPFPQNDVSPYSAWDKGSQWRPTPPEH